MERVYAKSDEGCCNRLSFLLSIGGRYFMKLNRTGSNWSEMERNKTNENWRIIEGNYNDVVDKVSEEAFEKVVDSAKLNWKEPVDSFADLPSAASEGDTRMARDSGKVYRFNGEMWQEIQQIDAGPVHEIGRAARSAGGDIAGGD